MREIRSFADAVLNSLTAHIAVLNRQGMIIAVNDAWRRFAWENRAPGALVQGIGLDYLGVCRAASGPWAEGAQDCLTGLLAVLDGSRPFFEWEYPCHSPGEQRWFFLRAVPLIGRQGGLVISHIDISERKQAQEALRDSEARFRTIADAAPVMIWMAGTDQGCTYFNKSWLAFTGRRPEDELGEGWTDGIHPDDRPACLATYRGAFEARRPFRMEYRLRRADGHYRWLLDIGVPHYTPAGGFAGYIGSCLDITEARQAAQELGRMRSYLKNIVDSMPSILVGVDPEGRVIEWNQGAQQATGVSAADAAGRSVFTLLAGFDELPAKISRVIERRRPVPAERVVDERNGELRYLDIMVYPLLVADQAMGAVVRIDDITRRVRMEQMLVQTEKMLSIGGLAAGMAHELNNPLGVVIQGSQNILRRLAPELPANQRAAQQWGVTLEQVRGYLESREIVRFLEGIDEAARRAGRIVADMLAFSNRGRDRFEPKRLEEMLETAVRLADSDYDLKKQYDFRQVEIVRDYDPALGEIHCNPTAIEQVLLNLLKNAAQAMAYGAAAPPHRIVLRSRREGDWARLEVEDNGPGIDEKTRGRLFEPFFTTKPLGVGTGLGLSVSYFIITEQHGGTIALASTPGKGTCVTIRLPLRRGV